jgi:hypothetical protein
VSNAYCVEFEVATSATGPGKSIDVGDETSSLSDFPFPKYDPQWATTAEPLTSAPPEVVRAPATVAVATTAVTIRIKVRREPSPPGRGELFCHFSQ